MYFDQVAFGERLRELRKRKGLSQEAMAELLNTSKTHYGNMERGKKGVSIDFLLEIAETFHVSTDYLLMGRDYVNLHSRKRLEGVLQELSGIIADLQDV